MKGLLFLLCFTTISAFSQTTKPLLEKLKKTQEQLRGTLPDVIPNQEPDLDQRTQRQLAVTGQKKPQLTIISPRIERPGQGRIPNLIPRFSYKPRIIVANEQTMVIALPQDNMPCLVPNMEFWKKMPNAGNKIVLEEPIDRDIYLYSPKS
jgi:hypothetical protein